MIDKGAWKRYQKRLKQAKGDPRKIVEAGREYTHDNLRARDRAVRRANRKGCAITALALVAGAAAAWKGWA